MPIAPHFFVPIHIHLYARIFRVFIQRNDIMGKEVTIVLFLMLRCLRRGNNVIAFLHKERLIERF